MAGRLNMVNVLIVTVVAAAMLQSSAAQKAHVVGDALGWTIPPGGSVAYTTWAASQNITVGDILVFNFTTGEHDVAKVTKDAFEACNATNTLTLITTGPANVTVDSAGVHYFICTFGSHCVVGQKLAVNVSASAAAAPAPSPNAAAPSPTATPPSPTASPPSPTASPPSPTTSPPSPTASPPSPTATPPSPTSSPPSPTATAPSSSATPPPTSTTPSSPSPASDTTPPKNSAPSFAVAGIFTTFLSVAVALLY